MSDSPPNLNNELPGETLAQQRLARFRAGKGGGETKPE